MNARSSRRHLAVLAAMLILSSMLVARPVTLGPVRADHTPDPISVTIAGDLQSELGCPGDWQPECSATHLAFDGTDDVWQGVFAVPAGDWQYKAALNDNWDENYGANAQPNGANIPLNLGALTDVKFYYDHKSHWVTDNVNSTIATVAGSFQSELGCPGDWQPWCLRSWLQDPDGDGVYEFATDQIPGGSYELKVALDEAWDISFPGSNVPFTSADGDVVIVTYDSATNDVTVTVEPPLPPGPSSVTIVGDLQDELGCPGDWQPDCAATHLTYDAYDDVWQQTFSVPAGDWEYKAALNDSWDENYGANAQQNGPNIPLNLGATTSVKFYYDHKSHWVTDNVNSIIATAPGSYQSEIGCSGDWDPGCLRSWLQDADGDGTYGFATSDIPAGNYEVKVAINESWDENYGQGGVANGPDIPFVVAQNGSTVVFTYDPLSHILSIDVIPPGHGPDNNVEYDGLGHNSQDSLYRVPFGAITPDTELILHFRTYHNDVTSVRARFWDDVAGGQFFRDLELVARDVSCYDPEQPDENCDFWETRVTPAAPTTLYYRFIVQDGTATAYYDDDAFRDGEWGEATPEMRDNSYVVTVHDSAFQPIPWLQNAVVYQIFPDRFRNGRSDNNASPYEPRYGYPDDPLDQIIVKAWDELPEGYCRKYQNPAQACEEGPRGRDYYGGDLRGVTQRLNYLEALGVTAIYFNPIFEAASNHAYDTQDYYTIDHLFGTDKEFTQLVEQAGKRGIKIILDGVFNHVSSDSPYFDRYGRFDEVGACESVDSPYRTWFIFRPLPDGPCAGPDGPNTMTYEAWWGFESLPVLEKDNPEVRSLIYAADDAVARYWLEEGGAGWRLDVMGDPSFPGDFWPEFRQAVKDTDPDAPIVGELWKKFEVIGMSRGDKADTAMNYRFRNAIQGFLGRIDDKGFVDDGQTDQPPSLFVRKLNSVREDYPDATYYTLLNLMDSHDTERILWSLTPGENNREDKEFNAANLARGKEMLRLATVVQMTIPGAPTIYYGDEVGVTGHDDPDDRRTFPWDDDLGPYGIAGDAALFEHYRLLTDLRHQNPVFRYGDLTFLLADDDHRTLAYLMRSADEAAVVAINRSDAGRTLALDASGLVPSAVAMVDALGTVPDLTAVDGVLSFSLPPLSAAVLLPVPGQDLVAPAAPMNLGAAEGDGQVGLSWDGVEDAAFYRLYRSPVSGGGYVLLGETTSTAYTDTGLVNGRHYYYVVSAVDVAGNEGPMSDEAGALPHYTLGWANLQWPPTLVHTISAVNRTGNAYGQVWIDGVTSQPGPTPSLIAQLGFGPEGSVPDGHPGWVWVDAAFNVDVGNNDEFAASLLPESVGTFDYVYRYSTTGRRDWLVADQDGPVPAGTLPTNPGKLTVVPSGDTTPPVAPTGLVVVSASPAGIELAWDEILGDPTLYGYEVRRAGVSGGPYTTLALITGAESYVDTAVSEGETYYYVVRAVDTSFNRSGDSDEVMAVAERRTVSVTFNVTVPAHTPAGELVYMAGTLDRLDGDLPNWDPGGVVLTQIDATHWTITLTGPESTQIEYKYTLGAWDFVEKGATCEELANRTLVLGYGADGTMTQTDAVLNWRNVPPCGN
jgi:glycosidase/fibronectin type 3 domain-containing protein